MTFESGSYMIGFKYDCRRDICSDLDVDMFTILRDKNGKVTETMDLVFYNNLSNENRSVVNPGDSFGSDFHADEVVFINFNCIPRRIQQITLMLSIYDSEKRNIYFDKLFNQTFIIEKENKQDYSRELVYTYEIDDKLPRADRKDCMLAAELFRIDDRNQWTIDFPLVFINESVTEYLKKECGCPI